MNYLNLQLARYTGLFIRLRRYVSNEILCLLYYSIIYFRIKYGILSWGPASNSLLKKVAIRLNCILRLITNKSIYRGDRVWLSSVLVVTFSFLSISQPCAIITLILNNVSLPLCLLNVL